MNTQRNLGTSGPEAAQPLPACPNCRMVKNDWPGEGYTYAGQTYCCQGCAEGTGCTCIQVRQPGFSREGQTVTRSEPRPGNQRSGASAPKGELSGERDPFKTEEAIDQSGNSTVFSGSPADSSEPNPKK